MLINLLVYYLKTVDELFFVNLVSSLDHAVLGLTLVLYPNAVWLQKTLTSHVLLNEQQGTQSSTASNPTVAFEEMYSDLSMIAFMGAGTTLLSVFLYHVMYLHDQREERVLLRLKMVNYICQFLLTLRSMALTTAPGPRYFFRNVNTWLLARLVVDTAMMLWLGISLHCTKTRKASLKFKSVQMAVFLELAYYGSIAYILLASSSESSTGDDKTPFWKEDIAVAFSWQGVHLLAMMLVLLWNVERVPKADAKILLIQNILFVLVLVRAMFHAKTRSLLLNSAHQLFLLVHALLTALVWKLSGSDSLAKELSWGSGEQEPSTSPTPARRVMMPHEKAKVA